jgi:hypothetical protein
MQVQSSRQDGRLRLTIIAACWTPALQVQYQSDERWRVPPTAHYHPEHSSELTSADRREETLSMRRRLVLASALALLLAVVLAVGAPPSEFAPKDSRWWMLEPLMFPGLFAGVIFAFVALILCCVLSGVRAAAMFCLLAPLSTLTGLVIAEGISDHALSLIHSDAADE